MDPNVTSAVVMRIVVCKQKLYHLENLKLGALLHESGTWMKAVILQISYIQPNRYLPSQCGAFSIIKAWSDHRAGV